LTEAPYLVVLVGQLRCTLCQGADSFNLVEQLSANLTLQHIIQEFPQQTAVGAVSPAADAFRRGGSLPDADLTNVII